jgi:hypothetical protein
VSQGTLDYSGFDAVDMVIEAALEDLALKQQIFADLEKACRKWVACARVPVVRVCVGMGRLAVPGHSLPS